MKWKYLEVAGFALMVGGMFFCFALAIGVFLSFGSKREELAHVAWFVALFIGLMAGALSGWLKHRSDRHEKGNHSS